MPKEVPTVSSIDRSPNVRVHRRHSPFPSARARVQSAWRCSSPSSSTHAQRQGLGVNSGANYIGAHISLESDNTSGLPPLKVAHGQIPEGPVPDRRCMQVSERDTGPTVHDAAKINDASMTPAALTNRHSRPGRDSQIARKHHQLLQEKDARIEELNNRISLLETSVRRLKTQKLESNDRFANKDAELGEVTRALQIAEETLDEKENATQGLIREVHHYQGWWLNEYYCLKVALKLARNQNDEGVTAMKESSHARFMKWSGSHQP